MTQPVDTLSTPDLHALAAGAAKAAVPMIPSPHPLTTSSAGAAPDPATPAFVAPFTGTTSGEVVLALDESVVTALSSGTIAVQVEDAVQPALEAAAQSLGPCVLGPVRAGTAGEVVTAGTQLVTLVGNGTPTAWIGLAVKGEGAKPATRTGAAAGPAAGASAGGLGLHLLRGVEMTLSVEIGRARMTVRDLLQLAPGSVVELDRAAGAPADLLVNGRLIARGEVVVVDEDFGLRITELVQPAGEASL